MGSTEETAFRAQLLQLSPFPGSQSQQLAAAEDSPT